MAKMLESHSSRQTAELGEKFGRLLSVNKRSKKNGATVLALYGDLGAGKTTFTQGFARGLGIKRRLISPTFVIMRRYAISSRAGFKNLYHIDAYRIKKADALAALGIKEILIDPTAIILVEWPENIKKFLPRDMARVKFEHGKKESERHIKIVV